MEKKKERASADVVPVQGEIADPMAAFKEIRSGLLKAMEGLRSGAIDPEKAKTIAKEAEQLNRELAQQLRVQENEKKQRQPRQGNRLHPNALRTLEPGKHNDGK